MHLKVFLTLKNPKNSLFWANIYKKITKNPPPQKKNPKKTKKKQKNHWAGFLFKKTRVFSNPALRPAA